MFCESFPPSRAKSDRQRKQGWLTVLSFALLFVGFVLMIVWLVFFLEDIMRVQRGAEEYNDAVAAYNPSPVATWVPGLIGENQALVSKLPITILGETFSVDVASSTVLSTVLYGSGSGIIPTAPFNPTNVPSTTSTATATTDFSSSPSSSETAAPIATTTTTAEATTSSPTASDAEDDADAARKLMKPAGDIAATTTATEEPPSPYSEQIFYSFVHVQMFERSPIYVKLVEQRVACPRKDKMCSNETMEVFCKSKFGSLASYRGSGCPPAIGSGGAEITPLPFHQSSGGNISSSSSSSIGLLGPPRDVGRSFDSYDNNNRSSLHNTHSPLGYSGADYTCGSCQYNVTLRTYCVVVAPAVNSTSPTAYVESTDYQSCYYPFADPNADQDFYLNVSAKSFEEQFPSAVTFIVRKSDDPFIAAQMITQGTMVIQNQPLNIYLVFIMPTATFLAMGIIIFFIGVKVGRKKKNPNTLSVNDSDSDDDISGRASGRLGNCKTVSGRLAVAVVVNSQNGESIPLLIDTKEYNESQRRLMLGSGGNNSPQNAGFGRRDSAKSLSYHSRSNNNNNNAAAGGYDAITTIMTASGDDGTVSASEGVLSHGVGYGCTIEPVGYGDEPIVTVTATMPMRSGENAIVSGGGGGGSSGGADSGNDTTPSRSVSPSSGRHAGAGSSSNPNSASNFNQQQQRRRSSSSAGGNRRSGGASRSSSQRRSGRPVAGGGGGGGSLSTSPTRGGAGSGAAAASASFCAPSQQGAPVGYGQLDGEPVGYGDLDYY